MHLIMSIVVTRQVFHSRAARSSATPRDAGSTVPKHLSICMTRAARFRSEGILPWFMS